MIIFLGVIFIPVVDVPGLFYYFNLLLVQLIWIRIYSFTTSISISP